MANPDTSSPRRLKALNLAAFALIATPVAAVEVPLTTYLAPLYTSSFGFGLATIGLIFLVTRLIDAIVDPLVGTLSDHTRGRHGRRRPYILLGGLLFGCGAVPLFFPPANFDAFGLAFTLVIFFIGYSLMVIPFSAWVGELSSDYHERTRVATYSAVMTNLGLLLALVFPALLSALPFLLKSSPALAAVFPVGLRDGAFIADPRVRLGAMGLVVFVLLVPALLIGPRSVEEPPAPAKEKVQLNPFQALKFLLSEVLLLRVLASNFSVRLGQSIRTALFVFVIAFVMRRPEWAPGLFLLQYLFGVVAGPIWLIIGRRIGKHRAAVAGELIQAVINLSLLGLAPGRVELLLVLTVAQGLAQGSGNLMLRAIVADVADHHRLKTGVDRTGLFFSVFSLSDKSAMAAAIGIALPLVAVFGFSPKGVNTPAALQGLLYVFALGPAFAHVLSAVLIAGFPINEHKHRQIRAELDALERHPVQPLRVEAAEPTDRLPSIL